MTNKEIIEQEQIRLADEGILKVIGVLELEADDGTIFKIPKIQSIHTYNAWKSLGYQVKKGEKAVAKFPIWKFSSKKQKNEETGETEEVADNLRGHCFMKVSAFFTDEQVEKIEEDK